MIEILMASFFVFSSIYGAPTVALADGISTSPTIAPLTRIEGATNTILPTRQEIEQLAKEFFRNDPILVDIARCESQFRQFDVNGNVLKGKVNKGDLGLMQINKYYHADTAKELGFNLRTLEGNMAYAQYLYDKEGVKPWISSSDCWKGALNETNKNQVALR
jgi:hypothetical protein